MKILITLLFVLGIQYVSLSQNEFAVWSEVGIKGDLTKKIKWSSAINARFAKGKVETFFPQVSL